MCCLVTRTFSSCGHGCSGHSHAVVTRTFSSCGHECSGHSHALVTRTFSSCGVDGCLQNPETSGEALWIGRDYPPPPPPEASGEELWIGRDYPPPPPPATPKRFASKDCAGQPTARQTVRMQKCGTCSIFVRGDRNRENVLAFCTWCKTQARKNCPQIHLLGPWVPA